MEWLGDPLRVLDQTALPLEERRLDLLDVDEVAGAIRRLAVRGAPLLGVTAAFGVALAAVRSTEGSARGLCRDLRRAGKRLVASRPTAVNVAWAVERVLGAAEAAAGGGREAVAASAVSEARAIDRAWRSGGSARRWSPRTPTC